MNLLGTDVPFIQSQFRFSLMVLVVTGLVFICKATSSETTEAEMIIPSLYNNSRNSFINAYLPNQEKSKVFLYQRGKNDYSKKEQISDEIGSHGSLDKHTKRKKLRQKLKLKAKNNTNSKEDIVAVIPNKKNSSHILHYYNSEKKYFDYFPIEDIDLEHNPKDDNIRVIILSDDFDTEKKSTKHRNKRSSWRIIPQPNNIDYRNRLYERYPTYRTNNDPWNNKYIWQRWSINQREYNRFYNDFRTKFIKYPVPGSYYNPANFIPPRTTTTTSPPFLFNRFGGEDEQDRVVWEIDRPRPFRNNINSVQDKSFTRTTTTPVPPLIHRAPSKSPDVAKTTQKQDSFAFGWNQRTPVNLFQSSSVPVVRSPQNNEEFTKCIQAIIVCCSRNGLKINYRCFENNGCHGAFWEQNPCTPKIINAALNIADRYFV